MFFGDYHVHTGFSGDSDETPERVLQMAWQEGLQEVAFTDHIDLEYPDDSVNFDLQIPHYMERMTSLRQKWRDQVQVRLGLEVGMQAHLAERLRGVINFSGLDFVIGSIHCVPGQDFWSGTFFRDKTKDEAHRIYFETVYENLRIHDGISVLGHLDFIRRYGAVKYGPDHREIDFDLHWDVIEKILRLAIHRGVGLELNTSGYRYGLDQFHPHSCILRRYRELGGDIVTLGSDAHRSEDVGRDFAEARVLLDRLGFQYICGFSERNPVFHPIRNWCPDRVRMSASFKSSLLRDGIQDSVHDR